jgi:hypothetical protein
MTDDKQARERQAGGGAKKDARQDRLKRALRENLKRRKSQSRGRGEVADTGIEGSSRQRRETKPGS